MLKNELPDLGEWGLDDPEGAKNAPSFFGRARTQCPLRGQCMVFFPKDHPIYKGHLKHFNLQEIMNLRNKIDSILKGEKYIIMAELAGIEMSGS
jgi:hypothetical protein